MINLKIVVVPRDKITSSQRKEIKRLQEECFGKVNAKEIKEHFFPEGFAWVLAYYQNQLVGILELHKRDCEFEGSKMLWTDTLHKFRNILDSFREKSARTQRKRNQTLD